MDRVCPRVMSASKPALFRSSLWQILLLYRSDDDVVGIDHFGEVESADFGAELVSVKFGETVVGVDPVDQFGDRNADGVIHGPVDPGSHDFVFIFESRPVN